ncbi:MAG TPA: GNAT family N-acetyltransferase [Feifaniaceae bacterium]|nr:GNAT family N-acetyltransferase [Feifaniaceae bacterium]
MELIRTDGKHPDFIRLCAMLDAYLNALAGGEEKRAEYVPLNRLDHIHDAFVLYDGALPVGCASFKEYEEGVAEVKRVFVREEYRGRGLSWRLMEAVEGKAREKGYVSLILETGRPLISAIALYTRMGYRIIPNYGPYVCMGESVCMRKEL